MSRSLRDDKMKNLVKTAIWAAASAGLYTAVFANEATVTKFYTMGNFYAALPVFTALAFSVIHGSFASQCFETLGITARKTDTATVRVTEEKRPAVQKDRRPRLQAN
jgi:hypothetical protein